MLEAEVCCVSPDTPPPHHRDFEMIIVRSFNDMNFYFHGIIYVNLSHSAHIVLVRITFIYEEGKGVVNQAH